MTKTEEEVKKELEDTKDLMRYANPSNYQFLMGRQSALLWWLSREVKIEVGRELE